MVNRTKTNHHQNQQVAAPWQPFCSSKKCDNYQQKFQLIIPLQQQSCKCGETGIYNWVWDSKTITDGTILLSDQQRHIIFHPTFSAGTAALKGIAPFTRNQHHYWEMKMISTIYGTDVMIGVGTSDILAINSVKYEFMSLLGCNDKSWGFSYNGHIQHNGVSMEYGQKFGMGCLIGVHLDMFRGTLEFYCNRKALGIAFSNLKPFELYPLVSSTAAQSSMRLTCAISIDNCGLQVACLKVIAKNAQLDEKFNSVPGLKEIFQKKFFWLLQ